MFKHILPYEAHPQQLGAASYTHTPTTNSLSWFKLSTRRLKRALLQRLDLGL